MATVPSATTSESNDGRNDRQRTTDDRGADGAIDGDRVHASPAELEMALRRSERRRRAAEQWGTFLERELRSREECLEAVITQYEAQLDELHDDRAVEDTGRSGWRRLWSRLQR